MANDIMKKEKKVDPYTLMDRLDDEIIIAELEGRVIDKWVYHFKQDKNEVWGLSKVGVDMACREMAKMGEAIREENIEYTVDPTNKEYVLFRASASRVVISKDGKEIMLDRTIGTKRQWIKKIAYGQKKDNEFWFEQGSIKALRNARARLLSEEVRAKIIALAKEKGKTKEVEPSKSKSTGSESKDSFLSFLKTMKEIKQKIGEEKYYYVLKRHGFSHANEIKDKKKQVDIFEDFLFVQKMLEMAKKIGDKFEIILEFVGGKKDYMEITDRKIQVAVYREMVEEAKKQEEKEKEVDNK
jgi:hypothetical protein